MNLDSNAEPDFQLTVNFSGSRSGTVNVNAGFANCQQSCTFNFPANKLIQLGALTKEFKFSGWQTSGPAAACNGKTQDCLFSLTESTVVTARFDPGILLTLSRLGEEGGQIRSDAFLIQCPTDCQNEFTPGSTVTLTPSSSTSAVFVGWLGGTGSATVCTGSSPCTFTITQPSTLQFMFSPIRFNVPISRTGTGTGSVTYSDGGSCPSVCSRVFAPGAEVTVEATAFASSRFTKWTGGPCKDQTTARCTFVVNKETGVTAEFALLPKVTLSVSLIGNDDGSVASSIPGIACGEKRYTANTCSASYQVGQVVTLTAQPEGVPKSDYKGWFQGTGSAVSCTGKTSSSCTITMTENSSIGAKFCRRVLGC